MSERGFSLMEMMLVCGLIGITSLAIVSLMDNMNSQMTSARMKTDSASLIMSVQAALKNSDSCKYTLQGSGTNVKTGITNFNLSHVKYYDSVGNPTATIVPNGGNITPANPVSIPGNPFLQVTGMKLTQPGAPTLPPISIAGGNNLWAADLVISYQQKGSNVSFKPYTIAGLVMQSDPTTGKIKQCKLGMDQVCVTGFEEFHQPGNSSKTGVASSDSGFSGNFSDAFVQANTGGRWGLTCQTGWKMTGCTGSGLKPIISVTTTWATNNSCLATDASGVQDVSRVYLSCCSM